MLKSNLIDPVVFAKEGRFLKGKIAIEQLDPRISTHEFLADVTGKCEYELQGGIDAYRRHYLEIKVQADLNLVCQRCLETLPFLLEEQARIVLFSDEQRLDEAMMQDEELEGMMIQEELDIMALVEDQMIMGLPLAPKHDNCDNQDLAKVNRDKPNPFAILGSLKK